MGTQGYEYQKIKKLLMPQVGRCRDRDVRIKVEFLLLGLKRGRLWCQKLGLGRSTFYKWWSRLLKSNFKLKALEEPSRRPRRSPNQIDPLLEGGIRFYRRKGYSALMIREYLRREGRPLLSVSTIQHVINKRCKPIKKRRAKLKKHRKRYELVIPGQQLQMDVKYSPMLVGGRTIYIYVAVDECTRWRFAKAYEQVNEHWTLDFVKALKAVCPFPIRSLKTDNGHEFTSNLLPGNTRERR